jgi:hypothetical protein
LDGGLDFEHAEILTASFMQAVVLCCSISSSWIFFILKGF